MDEMISDFLKDCLLRNLTKETVVGYRSNLRIFSFFLFKCDISLRAVDGGILRDFISYLRKERGNSDKRIKNYFSTLSSFYNYLVTEDIISSNPVPPIQRRYLRTYKKQSSHGERRVISVEEMSRLVNSILDPKFKAIAVLFAKTGIRRGELVSIELVDIHWNDCSILLKPHPKRTNLKVYFDDETARILQVWQQRRDEFGFDKSKKHLFVSKNGTPIQGKIITAKINRYAEHVGLHDPSSDRADERFSPHYFRHWFTTWLLRNGMRREFVKELRGDAHGDTIDIYNHIDHRDLRNEYIRCIPKLGIF